MNIYTFIITSLIIIIIPGAGVIYTISTGITKGKKASIFAAIGCTACIIPHLFVSTCISFLFISISEKAFIVLKILGALYLFYFGASMIFYKTKLDFYKTINENKASIIMLRGILLNLLNPKPILFFLSYIPQYISKDSQSYIIESSILGLVFMILTFVVFIIYGIMAGAMKNIVMKSPKMLEYIQKLFGIIFIVFAINLVMSSL